MEKYTNNPRNMVNAQAHRSYLTKYPSNVWHHEQRSSRSAKQQAML
jgi:hypothetical protein